MGSPVLANLFMSFHEKRWLDQFQFCDVLLYCRYVDDIIHLFNSEQDAEFFKNFSVLNILILNSHVKNDKDDKLAFHDALISKTEQY